jgi:hypothetical protein
MPERLSAAVGARGWLALAGLAAAIAALRGLGLLFDHSLNSIDGALQTWFALDHFARGEPLGTAFQSYLGITMVLALLPVFMVFGQTLFASTLAASVAVVVGAVGTAYAIVWLTRVVPKARRWQVTVLLIFAFYYAGRMAAETVGFAWPATFDPGVSLRPLRGALPFLVLPFFVLFVRRALRGRSGLVAGLSLGLVAGAGLLWSNDAGIPLVIALALGLVMALHRYVGLMARMLASFGAGVAVSAGAILLAVTHGAPGPWLQYNFREVAGDQFWFFAPWERSSRILGVADLPNIIRHADPLSAASLIVLTACVLWAMLQRVRGRSAPVRGSAFVFVGASVIGTALIPQIGGHVGAEYNAITFVLGACAPLIIAPAGVWQRALRVLRPIRPVHITALTALAALFMIGTEGARLATSPARAERTAYDPALGFFVTPAYAEDLAAMRALAAAWDAASVPQDRRLLSVYTSPLDIAARVHSPTDVGSLIHALGPDKRAAFTALVAERQVAAVTTIAPDYSGWEGWIRRANWHFFRALYANYKPTARNDQQVLWVRAEGERAASNPATCRVAARTPARIVLEVTASSTGLATVTVTRQPPFAAGRGAMLTVTEASPDTAERTDRWADFPRYGIANTARLTLMAPVAPDETTRLTLDVLDGSAIGEAACTAVVDAAPDLTNLPPLPEGIARHIAERAS